MSIKKDKLTTGNSQKYAMYRNMFYFTTMKSIYLNRNSPIKMATDTMPIISIMLLLSSHSLKI